MRGGSPPDWPWSDASLSVRKSPASGDCKSLAAWQFASDAEERSAPLPDPAIRWMEIAAEVTADPDRRYTDDELGLPNLIDSVIFNTPVYIRFRTVEDAVAFDARQDEYMVLRDLLG